jgi:adenosine deaminase
MPIYKLDGRPFVSYMQTMGTNNTNDQLEEIVRLSNSKWMLSNKDPLLIFTNKPSVFNTLLNFSSMILRCKDNIPVSKYEHLLRWNDVTSYLGEDLLTISYLASLDLKNGYKRYEFLWDTAIDHDNVTVNAILERNLSDLHAHLNGSSYNFTLNWLSIMNHIGNRYTTFNDIEFRLSPYTVFNPDKDIRSIQLDVIKAAAIRFYMESQSQCPNIIDKKLLKRILTANYTEEIASEISQLQSLISAYSWLYGKHYESLSHDDVIDYAIRRNSFNKKSDSRYLLTVLSGERRFMYDIFKRIYSEDSTFSSIERSLFYLYLLIKSQFRQEIVQLNDQPGFGNFSDYEKRKEKFIPDGAVYDRLLSKLAVGCFFYRNADHKYMETRITPKDEVHKLKEAIEKKDEYIHDKQFLENESWKYYYIFHFIKKEENAKDMDGMHARHFGLRMNVHKQAEAIFQLRTDYSEPTRERVIGIDAANSEIACRPEVFAQAFRYLREHPFCGYNNETLPDLGLTYHVGEDYLDVVDGLRAVDEVLHYMNFRDGDRIGHGLVLGEDVSRYYHIRHETVTMSLQIIIDNAAWLYARSLNLSGDYSAERHLLKQKYETLFPKVYPNFVGIPSIDTYYKSWLLRGDDPELYRTGKLAKTINMNRWDRFALNNDSCAVKARESQEAIAQKLYCEYHYNGKAKSEGDNVEEWKLSKNIIKMIDEVREEILSEVERKHISIECNPTSNFRIGALKEYAVHPILRFNNYNINVPYPQHYLNVSINTDDRGVFSTSLEREFSLMAIAMEKQKNLEFKNAPYQIYDWIERVRQMGENMRFHK